ncbi:hypothetical protein ACEW7V_00450 [Areca yellow leaf disease phytoplasma]|uniref:hypothetical protein n=1 Tax=Areca yellow leaf disease phytoplasma TaxID=927614 RepID=UPI0035B4FC0E
MPSVQSIKLQNAKDLEKKLLNIIEKNNEDATPNPLAQKLLETFSSEEIIQGLLKNFLPKERNYTDIIPPKMTTNNSFNRSRFGGESGGSYGSNNYYGNNSYQRANSNFIEVVIINLGKKRQY